MKRRAGRKSAQEAARKNSSARAARADFRAGGPIEFNFCVFRRASARLACDVRRFGSERPEGASSTNGAMVRNGCF
jgi:hypothetical protein